MPDASTQCYYLDGARNQQGPVAFADIARFIRSGTITRDTLVWYAGMPDWRPAGQVNEFASLFAPSPPPMRPPMAPGGAAPMRAPGPGGGFGGYAAQATGAFAGGYAGKSMGLMGAISTCLRKYVDFSGRAARPEFWYWVLFQILLIVVVVIVGAIIGAVLPSLGRVIILLGYFVVVFGLFLPGLAVQVRRLHDLDKSGWWWLLVFVPFGSIVLLVFYCLRGTEGPNRFGDMAGP